MKQENGRMPKVADMGPHMHGSHFIFVSDQEAVRKILSSKSDFPKFSLTYELVKESIGNGLVTSSGDLWFSQRRLITPFFHFNSLQEFYNGMVELTRLYIEDLKSQTGFLNAKETFSHHTNRVLNTVAFGSKFDNSYLTKGFKEMNELAMVWFGAYILFGPIWNYVPIKYGSGFKNFKRSIYERMKSDIEKIRATPGDPKDFFSYLVHAKKDGKYLDADLIVDECFTFLFAGQDTTASTLSWISYYLTLNPRVQKKLQQEVDMVLQGRQPTLDDLSKLKYCKSVFKETLRIQPVVPVIDRTNLQPETFANVTFPKNSTIGVNIYGLQHDPDLWDDPDTFNPERWEDPKSKNGFVFVPFSAGPRVCIGSKFATQEILVTLSMLVQNFELKMDPTCDVSASFEGVLTPVGLKIKFVPRNQEEVETH
jgi:cytochrome P450